jgi:hypothetical protein
MSIRFENLFHAECILKLPDDEQIKLFLKRSS